MSVSPSQFDRVYLRAIGLGATLRRAEELAGMSVRFPRLRLAGENPKDGDGDGFVVGPDGKDDVPATAAQEIPDAKESDIAATKTRVWAKAKSLGASDQKADEIANSVSPQKAAGQARRRGGETDQAFSDRVRAKAKSLGASDEEADRLANIRSANSKPRPANKPKPKALRSQTDEELNASAEDHSARAVKALDSGDQAGYDAHAARVKSIERELGRRQKAAGNDKPASAEPAKAPETKAEQAKAEATKGSPSKPDPSGDMAAIRKSLPETLGASLVTGDDAPSRPETDKDVGEAVGKEEFDKRVALIHDDAKRMFDKYPRLAAIRDANPMSSVEIVATPRTVQPDGSRCVGWHERGDYTVDYSSGDAKLKPPPATEDRMGLSLPTAEEAPLSFGDFTVTGSLSTTGSMFRHEYGHHLEQAMHDVRQGEFEDIYESKSSDHWAKGVSKYGSSSSKELWAESFAAFTHKDYGSAGKQLPSELHNFWTKHLG